MCIRDRLRSIRMDVYAMDEDGIIYNSEMQKQLKYDLPKRSRYYQGMLDSSLLEPGSIRFNLLNDSYIIIITPYDVFGLGKYRYTFRARCDEELSCILPDGACLLYTSTCIFWQVSSGGRCFWKKEQNLPVSPKLSRKLPSSSMT